MLKRVLGLAATAGAVIAALSGCEASQISWANHFYAVRPISISIRLPLPAE